MWGSNLQDKPASIGVKHHTTSFGNVDFFSDSRSNSSAFSKVILDSRRDVYYFNRTDKFLEFIDIMLFELPSRIPRDPNDVYGFLSDRQIEFVEDTLHYLKTGSRKVSLETWSIIIDDMSSYIPRREREKRCFSIWNEFLALGDVRKRESLNKYIIMWCGRDGGFRDLAYTLKFLMP